MNRSVPFLTRGQIESEAEELLLGYGKKFGAITKPPIPADEILNTYLGVTLDFDDLSTMLGVKDTDVFGATWIERGEVMIDQSLDPTDHPELIGRYNFTVGHETGHWQLHRPYFLSNPNQGLLFEQATKPTIICRSSEAREPIEWQADFFSSCFLMPKEIVNEFWQLHRKGTGQLSVSELRGKGISGIESDDAIIERFVRPLARTFEVSPIAMRIRLENLGFIVRDDKASCQSVLFQAVVP